MAIRVDSDPILGDGPAVVGILSYKGFTTITNSGGELKDPHKNVSWAIIISISICVVLYLLVAFAVAGSLNLDEIIKAKDYVLAEAARPVLEQYAIWFTVGIAIVATVWGVIASTFAVSRMLAMLSEMGLMPHRHLGMPGDVQKHTLIYTIVLAILLTAFFDLSRIASLGVIFYLIMDIAIHWGILRHLKKEVGANGVILILAMVFDVIVLGAFLFVNVSSDPQVLIVAAVGLVLIFAGEKWFLKWKPDFLTEKDLLILEELGYVPASKLGSELLFNVISTAYERFSLIRTTSLPFENWAEVLGSERLMGARLFRPGYVARPFWVRSFLPICSFAVRWWEMRLYGLSRTDSLCLNLPVAINGDRSWACTNSTFESL